MKRAKAASKRRGPGRPVKNIAPRIPESAEDIFKAIFRSSRL